MKNNPDSRPFSVRMLILLQFLLGLGAIGGGGALLLAPDGRILQIPVWILKSSPFSDFLIPGALLFTFVGVYPLTVAYSLWRRPAWRWPEALNPFHRFYWGWVSSWVAGVIIIVWIIAQVLIIKALAFAHILYVGWGAAIILLSLLPSVRSHYRRKT